MMAGKVYVLGVQIMREVHLNALIYFHIILHAQILTVSHPLAAMLITLKTMSQSTNSNGTLIFVLSNNN